MLHNFEPPATEDEIRASAIQFVRKLSGFTHPSKANEEAFAKVRADKEREANDGHDGTWVAHPDLVPVVGEVFDAVLGDRPHQKDRLPQDHVEEYSKANIAFHQALISLSESPVLVDMTNDILLHVRGYRQLTIGRKDRTATSLPEHLAIIEALEARDTELAEKRARDHTLGLAAYVEAHGQELFN
jgi:DNA-binding FadR family transcriptional regulator